MDCQTAYELVRMFKFTAALLLAIAVVWLIAYIVRRRD